MVDSMKQIFLLKPEVLTPIRNGFMAKKLKWHLKAGSTVVVLVSSGRSRDFLTGFLTGYQATISILYIVEIKPEYKSMQKGKVDLSIFKKLRQVSRNHGSPSLLFSIEKLHILCVILLNKPYFNREY